MTMLVKVVLFCLAVIVYCEELQYLDVDKLDICYIPKNAPYKIYFLELNKTEHNFSVSASAEVLRDINSKEVSIQLHVTRCNSKEDKDSCVEFIKVKPKMSICHYLEMEFLGIKKITDKVVPPLRCPITKGNRTATDITYDLADFTIYPLKDYFWKVHIDAYLKTELALSLCIDAQAKNYTVAN